MELQFYGGNCVSIKAKNATIVVDDNLAVLGGKSITKDSDISLFTQADLGKDQKSGALKIDSPGEYEVSDVSIHGIPAQAHTDEAGKMTAVIYKIMVEDTRIAVLGHIFPDLSDEQLEALGTVDIAIVPVGGNGYTLDGAGAAAVIKKLEPKIIIPTQYSDKSLKYPVPADDLEKALHELAMEPKETVDRLKTKGLEMGEGTQLIVLERS